MVQNITQRKPSILALSLMFCVAVQLSFAAGPEQPQAKTLQPYECGEAGGPIKIDGRLDEPAWQRAEAIDTFFSYPTQAKEETDLPTTSIRLLWSKHALYMAWRAEDVDVWSFSDQNDDDLWRGDVVELFIKPSTSHRRYYEFVIAPNGALYDARYTSRGAGGKNRFKGWNAGVQVATRVEGTGDNALDQDTCYTGEMAIPWAAFAEAGEPAVGTVWRFGVFRIDFSHAWEKEWLMSSVPGALKNGFHSYENYRPMRFQDGAPASAR